MNIICVKIRHIFNSFDSFRVRAIMRMFEFWRHGPRLRIDQVNKSGMLVLCLFRQNFGFVLIVMNLEWL